MAADDSNSSNNNSNSLVIILIKLIIVTVIIVTVINMIILTVICNQTMILMKPLQFRALWTEKRIEYERLFMIPRAYILILGIV